KPLASFSTRLRRRRALNPRLTRILSLLHHHRGHPGGPPRALVEAAVWTFERTPDWNPELFGQPVRQGLLEVLLVPPLEDEGAAGCALALAACDCTQRGLAERIMKSRRPSRRGACSTTAISFSSAAMRVRMAWPISRCVISRPRNMTTILILWPSSRNARIAF